MITDYQTKIRVKSQDPEITARMTKERRRAVVHVVEQKKLSWAGLLQQHQVRGGDRILHPTQKRFNKVVLIYFVSTCLPIDLVTADQNTSSLS